MDNHNGHVRGVLRAADIDPDFIHIRTHTVPWNANRWAYHRRTSVIPMCTDSTAKRCYQALKDDPGAAEVTFIDGQDRGRNPLRPQVHITWR